MSDFPDELTVMTSCLPTDRARVVLWRETGDALATSLTLMEAEALLLSLASEVTRLRGAETLDLPFEGVEIHDDVEMILAVGDGWGGGSAFSIHNDRLIVGLPSSAGPWEVRASSRDYLPVFLSELKTQPAPASEETPVDSAPAAVG